jgi:hypothetical protein
MVEECVEVAVEASERSRERRAVRTSPHGVHNTAARNDEEDDSS